MMETLYPHTKLGWFEKAILLFTKNLQVQKNRFLVTTFEIVVPVAIAIAVSISRYHISVKHTETFGNNPRRVFPPVPKPFDFAQDSIIGYTPQIPKTDEIMATVGMELNFSIKGYNSDEMLERATKATNIFCGVVFSKDSLDLKSTMITYSIRYQERKDATSLVPTDDLFELIGPYNRRPNITNYFDNGFIIIKAAVDYAIIEQMSNIACNLSKNKNITACVKPNIEIFLQQLPAPGFRSDLFLEYLSKIMPLLLLISFLTLAPSIAHNVLSEKESGIKEFTRLNGMDGSIHLITWFMHYFIIIILVVGILTFVYCVRFGQVAVFEYSNSSLVYQFLFLFGLDAVMFCLFVSTLFYYACSGVSVIFFLSYVPAMLAQKYYTGMYFWSKTIACLLPTVPMCLGLQMITNLEKAGIGLQYNNFFSPYPADDNFSMVYVTVMQIIDILLYGILTLYLDQVFPGKYSIAKPFYFFLTKEFWIPQKSEKIKTVHKLSFNTDDPLYFEPVSTSLKSTVKIKGVGKMFKPWRRKKVALADVNIDFYQDQITILLGHNGSGKSTLFSIITGSMKPSAGTVYIGDRNMYGSMDEIYENTAFCPQKSILFNYLTVVEQLAFFAQCSGFVGKNMVTVDSFIGTLNLEGVRNVLAKDLNDGLKRKLSLGITLIKNTEFIFLDEPTAGLDPVERRQIWDLLLKFKKGRTIVLSTEFLEEAEILGDRIAIFAHGVLQCCGRSSFLRKTYSTGYHLLMQRLPECRENRIQDAVMQYVPNATKEQKLGTEISYKIPATTTQPIKNLFQYLEKNQDSLNISNLSISMKTLEDVYEEVTEIARIYDERHNPLKYEKLKNNEETSFRLFTEEGSESAHSIGKPGSLKPLFIQQVVGLFIKRLQTEKENLLSNVVRIFIPLILIMAVAFTNNKAFKLQPPLTLEPNLYSTSQIVPYETKIQENSSMEGLVKQLRGITERFASKFVNVNGQNSNSTVISYVKSLPTTKDYSRKLYMGIAVDETNVTGYYTHQPLHISPIVLGVATNTILKYYAGEQYDITTVTQPFPNPVVEKFSYTDETFPFVVSYAVTFMLGSSLTQFILEKNSKSKVCLILSGASQYSYWIVNLFWDLMMHVLLMDFSLIVLVFFKCFSLTGDKKALFSVPLLFFMFGIAFLPSVYVTSCLKVIKRPYIGFLATTMVNYLISCIGMFMNESFHMAEDAESAVMVNILLCISPNFCLIYCLNLIRRNEYAKERCRIEKALYCGDGKKPCDDCKDIVPILSIETGGMGASLIYLFLYGAFATLVLVFIETKDLRRWFGRRSNKKKVTFEKDCGVVAEDIRCQHNDIRQNQLLVLSHLKKKTHKHSRVTDLSLAVSKGECFGLFGPTGAGKTSTYEMLTMEKPIKRGSAYLDGFCLKEFPTVMQGAIGYCPQTDPLPEDLNCEQILTLYARIKGVSEDRIKWTVTGLIEILQLGYYIHTSSRDLRSAEKRKLSTAIALIGEPPVLYFDEPTNGMDPVARSKLWKILSEIKASGRTVMISSHRMEECKSLCDRIAIMSRGYLRLIGTLEELRNKFQEKYILIFKIKFISEADLEVKTSKMLKFLYKTFKHCKLLHQDWCVFQFTLGLDTNDSVSLSSIFSTMEKVKKEFELESFAISRTSMEQIFFSAVKQDL